MSTNLDTIFSALKTAAGGMTNEQIAQATGLLLVDVNATLAEALTGGNPDSQTKWMDSFKTGKCEVCSWQDGQGIRLCYIDTELGPLYHSNDLETFKASLDPSQLSLFESHDLYGQEWSWKEEDIDRMRKHLETIVKEEADAFVIGDWRIPKTECPNTDWAIDEWLFPLRKLNLLKEGYTIRTADQFTMGNDEVWPGFTAEVFRLQKIHECGGFADLVDDGEVLVCTGCDCRIVYAEHGVNQECDLW